MMAKFYSKISLTRMAELLGLQIQVSCEIANPKSDSPNIDHSPSQETEDALSALVVSKTIWAKIDRSMGVVNFSASKDPNETLNDWSSSIDQLMNLVGKINHLINKEEMIHHGYVASKAS